MIHSVAAVYRHDFSASKSRGKFLSLIAQASSSLAESVLWAAMLFLVPAGAMSQSNFGPQTLGVPSAAQNITVPLSSPGIVASVRVLTSGAPGLDFCCGRRGKLHLHSFPWQLRRNRHL